ncbi:hypothetical protein P5G50_16460 [Leifsonia sp. F6_8S_P_1B]|uniref:DNA modification methylase n=1 Tax=Leifsonia williamsii TaxID=3035919 RepID=A0ABT8KF44_9MICO|nr:hypothetical protein [Leifsonia williamsii]MDN4616044.1 hypothetical protein [Leifsonia williamsii]
MKARVAASVVLALSVALGTAGCGLVAPQATTKHYDASDGVSGSVGSIDVRNAIVVTGDDDSVGSLVVTLVNTDSKSHRVAVTAGDDSSSRAYVTVEPGQVKQVGSDPESETGNVFFPEFSGKPGGLFPVYFQYGDNTGVQLKVPVLSGGLPEYSSLVPPSILPAAP